jgi:hypothetical protein
MEKDREVKLRNEQWEGMKEKDYKSGNNENRGKVNSGGLKGKEPINTPRHTGHKDNHSGSRREILRRKED